MASVHNRVREVWCDRWQASTERHCAGWGCGGQLLVNDRPIGGERGLTALSETKGG